MYKNLYDCFKHWYNKGSIFFYSDTHFGDTELQALYPNRPSDEEQIKNINKLVTKNDTLVLLGDVGDVSCIKKLRGYKVLILGNHDKGASIYKDYFNEVYEGPLIISSKIILSHEPLKEDFLFNIHGHDHNNTYKDEYNNHMNVCGEATNYQPISLKSIINSGKLKDVDIHRETIDKAIIRKQHRGKENGKKLN